MRAAEQESITILIPSNSAKSTVRPQRNALLAQKLRGRDVRLTSSSGLHTDGLYQ